MTALDQALEVRDAIQSIGLSIYDDHSEFPELIYADAELEALLSAGFVGHRLTGPSRTRSKIAKQLACEILGYPAPVSFKRVRPRILAQDADIYVQASRNLQVWNEELVASRRFAVLKLDSDVVSAVRVISGVELEKLDPTGTLTSKYQAKRISGSTGSRLVSKTDTADFQAILEPTSQLDAIRGLSAAASPVAGRILAVETLFELLGALVGRTFTDASSDRGRGDAFHRIVCDELRLGDAADTGQFPDIRSQALEIKMQTASTVDLGLVDPSSSEVAIDLHPSLSHSDVRYVVGYGNRAGGQCEITAIVVSTGADFFDEFKKFGGLGKNSKRQIPLPIGFFAGE